VPEPLQRLDWAGRGEVLLGIKHGYGGAFVSVRKSCIGGPVGGGGGVARSAGQGGKECDGVEDRKGGETVRGVEERVEKKCEGWRTWWRKRARGVEEE